MTVSIRQIWGMLLLWVGCDVAAAYFGFKEVKDALRRTGGVLAFVCLLTGIAWSERKAQ